MMPLIDVQHRTDDLDRDLETARKQISEQDREELELQTQKQEDYRHWVKAATGRFRYALELYLKVRSMLRDLDDDRRRKVYQRQEKFSQEVDSGLRNLYGLWYAYAEMFEEKAKFFGRHGIKFDDELDLIGRYKREVVQVLRVWEPPVPSPNPSFQPATLSPEATARVKELFPKIV